MVGFLDMVVFISVYPPLVPSWELWRVDPAPLWRPGLLKSQHMVGFLDMVVFIFYYWPGVPTLGAVVCGPRRRSAARSY